MSASIKSLIRTIPDYPKAGVMFRDITTLFQDSEGLRTVVEQLSEPSRDLVDPEAAEGLRERRRIHLSGVSVASCHA